MVTRHSLLSFCYSLLQSCYKHRQEILGISGFIAPSYDIWKLGCLLFEAATETKLFDAKLREKIANHGKEAALQYSNQHYLLDAMVTVLGNVPREVRRAGGDRRGGRGRMERHA